MSLIWPGNVTNNPHAWILIIKSQTTELLDERNCIRMSKEIPFLLEQSGAPLFPNLLLQCSVSSDVIPAQITRKYLRESLEICQVQAYTETTNIDMVKEYRWTRACLKRSDRSKPITGLLTRWFVYQIGRKPLEGSLIVRQLRVDVLWFDFLWSWAHYTNHHMVHITWYVRFEHDTYNSYISGSDCSWGHSSVAN